MANKRKIIMDCDPGIDDAVALCLAAAHPEAFELLGITTVAGNQTIEKVTENALRLTDFYGLDVPVARGAKTPILRPPVTASDIHGKNGIGDAEIPASERQAVPETAVLFMKKLFDGLGEGEKITLIPTGPLTNIALLFNVFPEVKEKVEEIILMGGAASGGNVTPAAEFNIYEDPEAAAIVFDSGIPVVMCGLDATHLCGISWENAAALRENGGRIARAVGEMVSFYLKSPAYKNRKAACIHDAVTFMYLLHPEIFKGVKMPVTVDCSDGIMRGNTLCDMRGFVSEEGLQVTVLMDADGDKFQEYLLEAVRSLDGSLSGR